MASFFARLLTIFTAGLTLSSAAHAFTGAKASEARLDFQHWVELESPSDLSEKSLRTAVENQLRYLVGALAPHKSAPRYDHSLSDIRLGVSGNGHLAVHYRFQGTILVEDASKNKLTFPLPIRPREVYRTSTKDLRSTKQNPCTDEYFPEEKFFHYYWNPDREGCNNQLKEGIDYTFASGKLTPLTNTTVSYPEYERLPDAQGTVAIHLLMGKDEENRNRDPFASARADGNAESFRRIASVLENMGFSRREWSLDEVKNIVQERLHPYPYPYVLEFRKSYNGTRAKEAVVRLVFGDSDPKDGRKIGMPAMLKDAYQNAAVMIWDGHSGAGTDCGLPSVYGKENLRFPPAPDHYQIFQFHTCSSYSYYNSAVLAQRPNRQNLDIISNGLEAPFTNAYKANLALIQAIDTWAKRGQRTSYQRLTEKMENENLVVVTGDEDNSCARGLIAKKTPGSVSTR